MSSCFRKLGLLWSQAYPCFATVCIIYEESMTRRQLEAAQRRYYVYAVGFIAESTPPKRKPGVSPIYAGNGSTVDHAMKCDGCWDARRLHSAQHCSPRTRSAAALGRMPVTSHINVAVGSKAGYRGVCESRGP